jgi:hypothetical protein
LLVIERTWGSTGILFLHFASLAVLLWCSLVVYEDVVANRGCRLLYAARLRTGETWDVSEKKSRKGRFTPPARLGFETKLERRSLVAPSLVVGRGYFAPAVF